VIFEAGWFVGRLGIPRVCLLLKDGTTVQSDIDGISRIHFRENIEEKVLEIQRELDAAELLTT
jgi:predicted nucleotide-binding protein